MDILDRVETVAKATLGAVIAIAVAGLLVALPLSWSRGDTRTWPFMVERDYEALYRALVIPVDEVLGPVSPERRRVRIRA